MSARYGVDRWATSELIDAVETGRMPANDALVAALTRLHELEDGPDPTLWLSTEDMTGNEIDVRVTEIAAFGRCADDRTWLFVGGRRVVCKASPERVRELVNLRWPTMAST